MKIDVFDTYAKAKDGHIMHFDVFVKEGTSSEQTFLYAQEWLNEIGEDGENLEQSRCNFCHTGKANPGVESAINHKGYFVLQMEGCPNPLNQAQ